MGPKLGFVFIHYEPLAITCVGVRNTQPSTRTTIATTTAEVSQSTCLSIFYLLFFSFVASLFGTNWSRSSSQNSFVVTGFVSVCWRAREQHLSKVTMTYAALNQCGLFCLYEFQSDGGGQAVFFLSCLQASDRDPEKATITLERKRPIRAST